MNELQTPSSLSTAKRGEVHRTVLQCAAVCCSVLRCVAVCCSVLQYVAVDVLQCPGSLAMAMSDEAYGSCVAVCCSVLQCVAAMSDVESCCYVL